MCKLLVSATMLAVLGVVSFAPEAQARRVKISGLHSQAQIREACAAVGGWSFGGLGAYGCVNESKGTSVTCTPGGECYGEVPDFRGPNGSSGSGGPSMSGQGTGGQGMGGALPGKPSPVVQGSILDGPRGMPSQGPAATGAPGMPRPTTSGPIIR
jgi:hypothetical protein